MDEHMFLLAGALHSSKENNYCDPRRLISNVRDCCKRIEATLHSEDSVNLNSASQDVERGLDNIHECINSDRVSVFRERVLLSVLLCCPCVRSDPVINECTTLQSQLKALPILNDDSFTLVVRALLYHTSVYPLLASLPSGMIISLMKPCIVEDSQNISPGLLSMYSEFLRALLHSLHKEDDIKVENMLQEFVSKIGKDIQKLGDITKKNAAYFFLHLIHMMHLLISCRLPIKNPTPVKTFKQLQDLFGFTTTDPNNISMSTRNFVLHAERNLALTAEIICKRIDVNTWMMWNEINILESFFCCTFPILDSTLNNSLQTIVRCVSFFYFDKLKKYDDMYRDSKYEPISLPNDLVNFLKQIALDPKHDPDLALSLDTILSDLSTMTNETININDNDVTMPLVLRFSRKRKLINILLEKDTSKLFESNEVALFLLKDIGLITANHTDTFIKYFINNCHKCNIGLNWKLVLLEVCYSMPDTVLHNMVSSLLAYGCRDWLDNPNFESNLTKLANNLGLATESGSRSNSMYWWCVLQRPLDTVAALVYQCINMRGQLKNILSILTYFPPLTKAKHEKCELSILSSALQQFISAPSQLSDPQLRTNFLSLFTGLLSSCEQSAQTDSNRSASNSGVPATLEVYDFGELLCLLTPLLRWSAVEELELPTAIIEVLLTRRTDAALDCLPETSQRAALLLFLITALQQTTNKLGLLLSAEAHQQIIESNRAGDEEEEITFSVPSSSTSPAVVSHVQYAVSTEVQQCVTIIRGLRSALDILVFYLKTTPEVLQYCRLVFDYDKQHGLGFHLRSVFDLHFLLDVDGAHWSVLEDRVTAVLRLMRLQCKGNVNKDTTIGVQLEQALYEDWIHAASQILHTGLTEDWQVLMDLIFTLQKADKLSIADDCPGDLFALQLSADALLLLCRTSPHAARLQYTQYTAAVREHLRQRKDGVDCSDHVLLLCEVFRWWCIDHVTLQDDGNSDLPAVLLLNTLNTIIHCNQEIRNTTNVEQTRSKTVSCMYIKIVENFLKYASNFSLSPTIASKLEQLHSEMNESQN